MCLEGMAEDITERKRTEEELARTAREWQTTFDATNDSIWVLDRDQRVLRSNQTAERMFKRPLDAFIGKHCWEIVHGTAQPVPECPFLRAKQSLRRETMELREQDAWLEVTVDPILDGEGRFAGAVHIVSDITERKKTQEALRKAYRRLDEIIEFLPDATFVIDAQGRVIAWNRAIEQMTGVSKEAMMGRGDSEYAIPFYGERRPLLIDLALLPETDLEKEKYDIHTRTDDTICGEAWVPFTYGGTGAYLYGAASRLRDEEGNIVGAIESIRDITGQKRAEAERLRLITAIEQAAEGIYLTDTDWIIQYANPAFEKMLGYDRGEMMGWHTRRLKSGKHDRDFYRDIRETLQSGRIWSGRGINKKKDGTFIDADVTISPVRDGSGDIINYVSIHRDITRETALETRLLQAQKMEAVGTLAGGIAHDFNNILMAIQGYASTLILETDPDDPCHGKLKVIEGQVEAGANLTRQLLGFARAGKYNVRPLDLNRVLEKSSSMFGRTRKEIVIHRKLQENLWTVEADATQMEQVFLNLYLNAWQAMPAGGELHLETRNTILTESDRKHLYMKPGRYVKVTVTDTGTGMDDKTKERIFEPFFTTKEMGRGTGLGLAMVYGIVKGHEGYINVYSEAGKGTAFTIYLPATDKGVVLDEKPSAEIFRGEETILLVDDEEDILHSMKEVMGVLGYHLFTAGSGSEALRIYEENRDGIDLVILDMIMPGMGGGETFDRLKEINPDVRVILSSGYSIDGQASEIMARGCSGFIQKPVNIADLSRKIREVLDKKS